MKFSHSVYLGAWLLIIFNLLMSFGAVWLFVRMSPAIDDIIIRNEKSLEACEDMLVSLIKGDDEYRQKVFIERFEKALGIAKNNITEKGEDEAIKFIAENYLESFSNKEIKSHVVDKISVLGNINRIAMDEANIRAQKIGNGGAWSIVFMSAIIFLIEIILIKSIGRNLIRPMNEVYEVIKSYKNGDIYRRCFTVNQPKEVTKLFETVNDHLDKID
ncbi:MAG: hypothetical protein JXR48_10875 [Candidatus Delongbacteria bacterium]|nr:hypothetical protein [Candidatus Delongbacteria bacterium]MBN2835455.1 hypothetical protein [Candidatus Delongbacteria bacterium]